MNQGAIKRYGPLAAGRKASLFTQGELAEEMGLTVQTILNREKEPENLTISSLRETLTHYSPEGRQIVRDWLDAFLFTL